ncbi:hypothetical protein CEP54_007574 [Fusarium duplospermum]|uniref:Nephrocystin 3-like N-terminal domain-containing protein n=1 Tax=Fusarium duplospermum TaxID=1325734 RepID=A0A428Q0M7_9HYPO|nr:hypothetical protein CEP54_007574 [Fusarium duplospermum]
MAEAIGLAASVAGLVSLGLSVCKGLATYYDNYQSAENEVKLLCEEVNNLTLILQSFEDALKDSDMRLKLESSASTRPIDICMAGRGKTVLCSTIINHLLQHCEDKPTSGVAYFYFDYTNASISQHHNRLLRSLIEQLSSQNGAVPKPLKTLYERCRHGTTQPTEAELTQTLRNVIQLFSPCYLAIDAVDESKEKQEFLKLLNVVAGQWRLPQVHFLVTSRTELDMEIPKRTWQGVTMSIQDGIVGDVESQVLSTLRDENGALSQWDPDQREMIAKSLIDNSRGNFRWVACQLQALEECHTAQELDEALESLPTTLEETYERSLLAIEEKRREGFRHILRWLSFSARPMHLDEITEVLAIDFSAKPRAQYDPRKRLVNSAKFFHKHSNLVSVSTVKGSTGQHQELRLAHLSVRDYLLSNKIAGSPASYFTINSLSAHRSIAEACIVYLQKFTKSDEGLEKSQKTQSLAPYAARFWSYHVQAATAAADLNSLCGELLSAQLEGPLIQAAAEGHTATVQLLLKLGADSLLRDRGGWTALDESAPPGFDAVVRVLIDHDPAILQSRDNSDKSALHHTTSMGAAPCLGP